MIKRILLTNDDGYLATGIWAIHAKLIEAGYDVDFVAPASQYSWSGKSLMHDKPVTVKRESIKGHEIYIVDGSPATCVRLALHEIVKQPPDLVVSGINFGANSSVSNMMSSGTVGAAMEASFDGFKALATSLAFVNDAGFSDGPDAEEAMDKAADVTVGIIKRLEKYDFPNHTDLLNINTPIAVKSDQIKVCKPDRDSYGKLYSKTEAGSYNRTAGTNRDNTSPYSDTYYLKQGFATITPVSLELAPDEALESLKTALGAY
ncbi:5'/3'-nucleotidase SurE [Candidatus Saccharibacteria bacterium]|nr:5'/3'-nucleotidase SurE [Candidatus Saccharibacteria bacterium]MBP9132026.1 5'/3'-nucleotidase SurE [Candidatus Saccharibacteria bacterium]